MIEHRLTPTNLVQYNEYYPFGLQTANSWTRENTIGNNFLANGGTELNTTTGLMDLHYRNYDPALGRMNQVDPVASKYASQTPYNYAFNAPTVMNDPMGDDPFFDREAWRGGANRAVYYNRPKDGGSLAFGSHQAEDRGYRTNMAFMFTREFTAYYKDELSSDQGRWNIARSLSTPVNGSLTYSRSETERYQVNLSNGRVSGVQQIATPKLLEMIAMANKYFGQHSASLRKNSLSFGDKANSNNPLSLSSILGLSFNTLWRIYNHQPDAISFAGNVNIALAAGGTVSVGKIYGLTGFLAGKNIAIVDTGFGGGLEATGGLLVTDYYFVNTTENFYPLNMTDFIGPRASISAGAGIGVLAVGGGVSIGQVKNWESGMFTLAISRFIGLGVELPIIPSVNYGDTKLFR
jgi:RHS repeat-associated protein